MSFDLNRFFNPIEKGNFGYTTPSTIDKSSEGYDWSSFSFGDDEDLDKFATRQMFSQALGPQTRSPIYQLLLKKILAEQ